MTVVKEDLLKRICTETGVSKEEAKKVVDSFIKGIVGANSNGEKVCLRGLGTFNVIKRKERVARDIGRNKPVTVPSYFFPKFKPGKKFINSVKSFEKKV